MSIVIPPPPDFGTHDEEVPEFNSGTPSRTWYHYLLIVASLVFAAVSVGFIGTIFWNSLPEWGASRRHAPRRQRLAVADSGPSADWR